MIDSSKGLRLLPRYFKAISIGLFVISVFTYFFSKFEFLLNKNEVLIEIAENSVIVSMMLFAFSREKNEDELMKRNRIRSLASAFFFGVNFYLIASFSKLIFDSDFMSGLTPGFLILLMLIMYFFNLSTLKKEKS